MTIEEKAKAYDKALKIAKKNYDVAQDLCNGSQIGVECFKNTLTNIFPELGESEYERIRKRLIDLIYKVYAFTNYITCVEYENIIAWLEKQGDTTSDIRYDGVNAGASLSVVNGNSFDYEKATITQKDFAPEEEMVGEAKSKLTPFDKKVRDFLFSFYLKVSDGMPLSEMIEAVLQLNTILFEVEQKQEWSEEDDYNLQCMIAKVTSDIQKGNVGRNNELIDWLKSLKDRMKGKEE